MRPLSAWPCVVVLLSLLTLVIVLIAGDDERVADCFHEMFWDEQRGAGCRGLFLGELWLWVGAVLVAAGTGLVVCPVFDVLRGRSLARRE